MKKVKIIQLIGIVLVITYIGLLITNMIFGYLGEKDTFILSIVLICISLSLIYKGVLLKSSSTLWFAICLMLFSILILVFNLMNISTDFYYLFVFIPIISSVINIIVFKYVIYIKVIIINISIAIPVVISHIFHFSDLLVFAMYMGAILFGIIICRLIYFRKEKF